MIDKALEVIVRDLNSKLVGPENPEPIVLLERLVNDEGKVAIGKGLVSCSVVSMEEERVIKHSPRAQDNGGFQSQINPDVFLNLFVLFAVNPRDDREGYRDSLRLLSMVIANFQAKSSFTAQNTPSMPTAIQQLNLEIYPLTIENQNHLWAGIGAKYLPSILYKVRLVAIRGEAMGLYVPLVNTIGLNQEGSL